MHPGRRGDDNGTTGTQVRLVSSVPANVGARAGSPDEAHITPPEEIGAGVIK